VEKSTPLQSNLVTYLLLLTQYLNLQIALSKLGLVRLSVF